MRVYIYIYIYIYISCHSVDVCVLSDDMYKPRAPWIASNVGKKRIHNIVSSIKWPSCKCVMCMLYVSNNCCVRCSSPRDCTLSLLQLLNENTSMGNVLWRAR